MIRITIELLPLGNESKARIIGLMKIWNDGTGTNDKGNYRFRISKCGKAVEQTWKEGEIKDFPRSRKNVWHLLHSVLNSLSGKESA